MSKYVRKGSHTVSHLTCHIVWATKCRYKVLTGDLEERCRELLIQVCDAEEVDILKGVVSSDHIHMHIEYSPKQSLIYLLKMLKGRSSRKLQQELSRLRDHYWGQYFWASGYGVWSTGNITDEMVNEYLEHHRKKGGGGNSNFILE